MVIKQNKLSHIGTISQSFYPSEIWTQPPTCMVNLEFWNFFNFASPLTTCVRNTYRNVRYLRDGFHLLGAADAHLRDPEGTADVCPLRTTPESNQSEHNVWYK